MGHTPSLGTSAVHLVWAHDLDKAALSDVTQANCLQQQLLRQEAGSELYARRIHSLERHNTSRRVMGRSREFRDHLKQGASGNGTPCNVAWQTQEHRELCSEKKTKLNSEKKTKKAKQKVMR